ncbi:MAG: glycosyltransferase family 2 protein [Alphaproteobacteria bacterium]|nr:glycosyltransferase family 2 protein [Alphaproteobacteria bacterium]
MTGVAVSNHADRLLPRGWIGFSIYTLFVIAAFTALPDVALQPGAEEFILVIGVLAIWRYGWAGINFIRSWWYRKAVFVRWRAEADENVDALMPSQIYLLITGFRIDAETMSRTVRAAIGEAVDSGVETTIVASIVELGDEFLFETLFEACDPPDRVKLRIVRIPGTGKRDGLAQGFRAISRDMPSPDAVVAVIDGDSVLMPGTLRKCVPFFKLRPDCGALTTDEICEVRGSALMKHWHNLRFAQRQILMGSIALSKRVMTLTGRMSMFRAEIVTNPDFINHMTSDSLSHWRLGEFKFLTGDDKSSLYWIMKEGWEQIYVPDALVLTLEDPPAHNFVGASSQLMFRWFGNMLRTNGRILKLGPWQMPFFVWWAFLDQRISMWTTLTGPVFALMFSVAYSPVWAVYYLVWVSFIRWVQTLMILSARDEISWTYPFLLYYGQIYGSLLKTWVLFRLDVQSWTRQKTKLRRDLTRGEYLWNRWTSHAVHATALLVFVALIGILSGTLDLPDSALRMASEIKIPLTG